MIRVAAVLVLSLTSAAAFAQQGNTPAATPDQAEEEATEPEIVVEGEKPKRVCETHRDTGSIMPRRVCRTPEQVAADAERAAIIKDRLSKDREAAQHTAANRDAR